MISKEKQLQELVQRYAEPTRQAMDNTAAKFILGDGNPNAVIMIVGEAPGLNEDRQGKPFVGRSGKSLMDWLASIGLQREDVYISNIVKCHPMKNPKTPEARGNDRPPKPHEIALCLPIMLQEILIIRPRFLLTLGSPSTRTLLQTDETITQLRGKAKPLAIEAIRKKIRESGVHEDVPLSTQEINVLKDVQVLPTFHPAALFHNPSLKEEVLKDLKTLQILTRS